MNKLDTNQQNVSISKLTFTLLVGLSIALLSLRINLPTGSIARYLWAEDATIFISQAQSLGLASLWQPYAGYLHLYPRLVALLASQFPLIYTPALFFSGWLLAYIFAFSILIHRALQAGIAPLPLAILVFLISIQPNLGEVFFTITNAQWTLGIALAIWALSNSSVSLITAPIWILLGLTGPFSLLLLPVLLLKMLVFKDFRNNWPCYSLVFTCGIVQLFFLVHSESFFDPEGLTTAFWSLALIFLRLLLLNAHSIITLLIAAFFWLILLKSILKPNQQKVILSFLLYCFLAGLILATAISKHLGNTYQMLLFNPGNRYTWIAYSLLLFAATLATKHQYRSQMLLAALVFLIFYRPSYQVIGRFDTQFNSFANFAHYKVMSIPINPMNPLNPHSSSHWRIPPQSALPSSEHSIIHEDLPLASLSSPTANLVFRPNEAELSWNSIKPAVLNYPHKISCGSATDVGLELTIERPEIAKIRLFWSDSKDFSLNKSLKISFPPGEIAAQYAFPNNPRGNYIRLALYEPGTLIIKKITIYCLP